MGRAAPSGSRGALAFSFPSLDGLAIRRSRTRSPAPRGRGWCLHSHWSWGPESHVVEGLYAAQVFLSHGARIRTATRMSVSRYTPRHGPPRDTQEVPGAARFPPQPPGIGRTRLMS